MSADKPRQPLALARSRALSWPGACAVLKPSEWCSVSCRLQSESSGCSVSGRRRLAAKEGRRQAGRQAGTAIMRVNNVRACRTLGHGHGHAWRKQGEWRQEAAMATNGSSACAKVLTRHQLSQEGGPAAIGQHAQLSGLVLMDSVCESFERQRFQRGHLLPPPQGWCTDEQIFVNFLVVAIRHTQAPVPSAARLILLLPIEAPRRGLRCPDDNLRLLQQVLFQVPCGTIAVR